VVYALAMTPVLNLLASAYGIGVPSLAHPKPLLAPQATLMASVARGMFGGALPWSMVITGGLIGIAIIVLDEILRLRGATFRVPVLAAAVGIYLPMDVTLPIFLGGGITWLAERALRRRAGPAASDETIERMGRKGVLFAAGLITGEALMGIVIAVPIVLASNPDVLALPAGLQFGQWLGVLVLVSLGYALYRAATAPSGP
jgi:putative OPT family oligopeptide transporter